MSIVSADVVCWVSEQSAGARQAFWFRAQKTPNRAARARPSLGVFAGRCQRQHDTSRAAPRRHAGKRLVRLRPAAQRG